MNLLEGVVSANYTPTDTSIVPDCIIGLYFGNERQHNGDIVPGPVNEALGRFIVNHSAGLPRLLQTELSATAALHGAEEPELWIKPENEPPHHYFDTFAALKKAHERMQELGLTTPLIAAQAHHVSRAARQAELLGMQPVVRRGLPDTFSPRSTQPWTRNALLWAPRELVGRLNLRRHGKL